MVDHYVFPAQTARDALRQVTASLASVGMTKNARHQHAATKYKMVMRRTLIVEAQIAILAQLDRSVSSATIVHQRYVPVDIVSNRCAQT